MSGWVYLHTMVDGVEEVTMRVPLTALHAVNPDPDHSLTDAYLDDVFLANLKAKYPGAYKQAAEHPQRHRFALSLTLDGASDRGPAVKIADGDDIYLVLDDNPTRDVTPPATAAELHDVIYFHFEDLDKTVKAEAPVGAESVLLQFLPRHFGAPAAGKEYVVADAECKPLALTDSDHVAKLFACPAGEDFYVTLVDKKSPPKKPDAPAKPSNTPVAPVAAPASTPSVDLGQVTAADAVEMAKKFESTKQFAKALHVYEVLRDAIAPEKEERVVVETRMAVILTQIQRHDEAVAMWEGIVAKQPSNIQYLVFAAAAHTAKKDHKPAAKYLQKAFALIEKLPPGAVPQETVHEIKVRLGTELFDMGFADEAIALVQSVLDENQQFVPALKQYSRFCLFRGMANDAIHWSVSLLVAQQKQTGDNPNAMGMEFQRHFADIFRKTPNNVEVLLQTIKAEEQTAGNALAFLAKTLRDNGVLEGAAELYRRAAEKSPHDPNIHLCYYHVFENLARPWHSVELCLRFCEAHPTVAVGSVTCKAVYEAAGGLKAIAALRKELDECLWCPPLEPKVRVKDDIVSLKTAAEAALIPPCASHLAPPPTAMDDPQKATQKASKQYAQKELDLLAIWMTMMKNLFVVGALRVLPPLVGLIAPLRDGYLLHTTVIRNEQAYFTDVCHLLAFLDDGYNRDKAATRKIYACGDSHSLSASWQVINTPEPTLLVNKIVTGLKTWHLREDTDFYPKYDFHNTVNSIPDGSTVVFMFGEIDCREGILRAVEKGCYKNLEEGMRVCIRIYIDTLLAIQKRKKFTVLVHPPLPILDVTRTLVLQFDELLKEMVQPHAAVLKFLDFIPKLLSDDRKRLLPEYELDSTHASPRYITHVEAAIAKVLLQRT